MTHAPGLSFYRHRLQFMIKKSVEFHYGFMDGYGNRACSVARERRRDAIGQRGSADEDDRGS